MEQILVEGFINRAKVKTMEKVKYKNKIKIEEMFEPIWDYISNGKKRAIGKMFNTQVNENKYPGLKEKNRNNAGRVYYEFDFE